MVSSLLNYPRLSNFQASHFTRFAKTPSFHSDELLNSILPFSSNQFASPFAFNPFKFRLSKCTIPSNQTHNVCRASFPFQYGVDESDGSDNLFSKKSQIFPPSKAASGELNPFSEIYPNNNIDIYNTNSFHLCHEEYEGAAIALPPSSFGTYTGKSGTEKKYRFHVIDGGQIYASVIKEGINYIIKIQITMSEKLKKENLNLQLHWGIFRTNRNNWFLLNPASTPPGTYILEEDLEAMRTPLNKDFDGNYFLSINFEAKYVPFALNFVLYQPKEGKNEERWFRNAKETNFCVPVGMEKGFPEPFGVVRLKDDAANFSIFSKNADGVTLCLFDDESETPTIEIDLEPSIHKTGNVWHVIVYNVSKYKKYGYRIKGDIAWENGNRFNEKNILLDPYANFVTEYALEKKGFSTKYLGLLHQENFPFGWENDFQLCIPMEELIMYKLNVSKFSICDSSKLSNEIKGTFKAISEKVDHFCNLGINAIVLEPIFYFDESQGHYFPISFFSPMPFYGSNKDAISSINDLKYMVKELHKKGIEVILEVVFSHTSEKSDDNPKTISYRGIDNSIYYITDQYGKQIKSEFGTENVFNCNHPTVQKMIIDCLRYWVQEFHVDGFLFLNSSSLVKGCHNQTLTRSLLIEALTFDPILARTKLIADFTSPINSITTDVEFPHWGRWMEMNHKFKIDLRKFIKGENSQLSNFATRMYGSADKFEKGRSPSYGINFISNNFNFNLSDLVSFSKDEENSWNYGEEGNTKNKIVNDTRKRQVKNYICCIFLSQGIPLLTNGVENFKFNSNNLKNNEFIPHIFDWKEVENDFSSELINFIKTFVLFRKRNHTLFQRKSFLSPNEISWHGYQPHGPAWENSECSLLGFSLYNLNENEVKPSGTFPEASETVKEVYVAFNAHSYPIDIELPSPPDDSIWHRVVDTGLPFPEDITLHSNPIFFENGLTYSLQPFSVFAAEARSVFVLEE